MCSERASARTITRVRFAFTSSRCASALQTINLGRALACRPGKFNHAAGRYSEHICACVCVQMYEREWQACMIFRGAGITLDCARA